MAIISAKLTHYPNPAAAPGATYPPELLSIASLEAALSARREISRWPDYQPTPLQSLQSLAEKIGVAAIYYKDESKRFHLKSFKALGGAFAVARQLQNRILAANGETAQIDDLISRRYQPVVDKVVISCATDGNHGRSVAWGCQMFGCACVIYVHRDVSGPRQQAMAALGAEIVRVDGNYDASVKQAAQDARLHQRIIVSDTSYAGYLEIPRDVANGYTVMLAEAIEQLANEVPSHVFIQAGVGGLAASVCAYFWELWGAQRPRFIVVEPEQANCLQQSAVAGAPVAVGGDLETLMAGLSCGEVSLLAWQILQRGANDFMTLGEAAVAPCMRLLADGEPALEAGESAVAGLAAAIIARQDPDWSKCLALDESSRIFVIGTEGATDPEVYQRLLAQR